VLKTTVRFVKELKIWCVLLKGIFRKKIKLKKSEEILRIWKNLGGFDIALKKLRLKNITDDRAGFG
jgi:hypothetical protein